ncbi:hypothetical protein EG329_003874 [Mollisiaceae sp. DMI_Dod_QoI]|nr:hypothetical protein EG329_003874 [Helotiales sp. DMI_Dod_QoI]
MANYNSNSDENRNTTPVDLRNADKLRNRRLVHDHIWSWDTCLVHGCPSCCGCASVPWLCPSCYEDVFFHGLLGDLREQGYAALLEYRELAEKEGLEESVKGKEIRDLEGEKGWLEIREKEGEMEKMEKEDEDIKGPKA